jgi:hypothetical protein
MIPSPGDRFEFILPLYVVIPHTRVKDEKHSLSYNHFTSLNSFVRDAIKKRFKPIYAETWEGYAPKIRIHYQIERMTRASFDTGNYVYILDKLFCDWLQDQKLIKDDNFSVVELGRGVGYNQCKKTRARVIVEILPLPGLQIKP